jgi:cytochrome c
MRHLLIVGASLLLAACSGRDATPAPQAAPPVAEAGAASSSAVATAPATAAPTAAISGEQAFAMCSACHSRQADAPQRMGPNLHDLIGRKAGTSAGFAYSPAMQGSGITWDAATLDAYLAAPSRKVPGTRMVISVPDAERRKALVEYLSAP